MQQMQEERTFRSCFPVQTIQTSSVDITTLTVRTAMMMTHKPPTSSTS